MNTKLKSETDAVLKPEEVHGSMWTISQLVAQRLAVTLGLVPPESCPACGNFPVLKDVSHADTCNPEMKEEDMNVDKGLAGSKQTRAVKPEDQPQGSRESLPAHSGNAPTTAPSPPPSSCDKKEHSKDQHVEPDASALDRIKQFAEQLNEVKGTGLKSFIDSCTIMAQAREEFHEKRLWNAFLKFEGLPYRERAVKMRVAVGKNKALCRVQNFASLPDETTTLARLAAIDAVKLQALVDKGEVTRHTKLGEAVALVRKTNGGEDDPPTSIARADDWMGRFIKLLGKKALEAAQFPPEFRARLTKVLRDTAMSVESETELPKAA